jgi:hypothetical protein
MMDPTWAELSNLHDDNDALREAVYYACKEISAFHGDECSCRWCRRYDLEEGWTPDQKKDFVPR